MFFSKYKPLFLIIIFATLLPISIINTKFNFAIYMHYVMGFVLTFFAFFKLLDLEAFVQNFAKYDLVAGKVIFYGYLYPFIELSLALLYLANWDSIILYLLTFLVMIISAIGIIKTLLSGQKLNCACLGGNIKLPLGIVSITENIAMAVMALIGIWQIN